MEKLIFENLMLKEHIQQLKAKKDGGDSVMQGQIEQSKKEKDELESRVQSLEREVVQAREQLAAKDDEILNLNDCNDKLASGIVNAISYMHEALKQLSPELRDCKDLEEALEVYTVELANQVLTKNQHCQQFRKVATELIAVVKALEQALRMERIPVPRPPKVDESNVTEYLKQLVYIMQGVCASKGRMVAREPPIIKREITKEEVQKSTSKPSSGTPKPEVFVPVKSEDPSLCSVAKIRDTRYGYCGLIFLKLMINRKQGILFCEINSVILVLYKGTYTWSSMEWHKI